MTRVFGGNARGLFHSLLHSFNEKNCTRTKAHEGEKIGAVDSKILIRLIAFVEKTPILSQEDKDAIIDGLADWA